MRDNQRSKTMRDATFSRRDVLWAGGALTVGAAFAERLEGAAAEPSGAGAEPTSWVDSAMPEVTHRMIETNGIRLHVAEQGEGPLVILCHGFPECWYSWRHQLPALAKAGSVRSLPTFVVMEQATVRRAQRSIRFSITSATSWVSSMLWVLSKQ
jgi:hypothetical protein